MKIINSFKILTLLGLLFTTSITVLAQVPTTGLLAHYKFESSGTCADETGNYNATSVSGPVLNTQGMIGNCYEFDGTNDKVDLPAIAIGNNTGTICGWFKKDAGSGTSRKVIGRFWQQHAFGVEGSGNYEGLWNDNWLGSSSVYDDSQWHFFALIYDGSLGSQNIKLWIDDYILTTSNATGNNINESSIWQIGTHGNNDHYWDGLIDEVRLYNRALTTTEIEALYDEPNSSNPTALDGGSISIADTIVNYGSQPPMITSSVDPSGGDCSESYTYDWQSSVGSANFVSLSVNSSTYQPAALTQSTTFRRVVYCGSDSAYSNNVINITVIQSTGSDSSAFHSDISQEIENLNEKTNPIGTDILLIEDSQDSYSKKKVQLDSLPARAINLEYLSSDTSGVINPGSGNSAVIPSGSTTIASLMLPEDKTKLDGIAENANNYTLPEATSSVLGGVIVDNTTITVNASGVITAVAASGEDVNAIHTNEPAEINALSTKAVPENSDVLVIEDSSDSYNKKKVLLSTLPGGTGTDDQNATEVLLASYSMPASGGSIGSSDDVQTAIGKLEKGLESATAGGGEDNVQADWNEGDTGSDAYILNKPTIPGYQTIDVFSLDGTVLSLSLENDSEATKTINLSAIQDGTGTDDQNATEVLLSSYSLPASGGSISSSDDVQTAIGKLEKGLESATAGGGEDNVQANWNEGDTNSDAYILNKPTIPTNNNQLTNGANYADKDLSNIFTGDISVPNETYGFGWNGSLEVPTKDAIYDKIELLGSGSGTVTSVSLSSSDLSISGSPITTSGTITANLASSSVDAANLNNNAISGRTALTSGLYSTDELFVSDGGILKKMDVSVIESYMQSNLNFGLGTVTSIALSSSDLSISGSPITSSGTLTANLASSCVDADNLNNNVISGRTALTSGLYSTDELFVSDGGTLKKMDISVIESYMQSNLSFGLGTVTSVALSSSDLSITGSPVTGSGTLTANLLSGSVDATNLNNNVISGRSALTSGLISTDELFISDGGTLKKMDVSVIQSYMQNNLNFGSTGVWTDNSTYINYSGKVGINTTRDPGTYHLEVNGSIHAKEVVIDVTNWADYVFGSNYNLKPLNEVESFIKENKHLPEIPSAKEVEEEGIDLGEMNMLLLKKVEELTLYLLQQEKRIKELEERFDK